MSNKVESVTALSMPLKTRKSGLKQIWKESECYFSVFLNLQNQSFCYLSSKKGGRIHCKLGAEGNSFSGREV